MYYGIAGIVSFGATMFFWWSYSGPYRLIAGLQQSLWGVNLMQLTLALCWAALFTPLYLLVSQVEKRAGITKDPLTWTRFVAMFNFLADTRAGQGATFGILLFCMGGWFLGGAVTSGPLTTFTVAQAERGERPASNYVRITDAKILTNVPLTYTRNSSVEHYYPVVSRESVSEKFKVFVRLDGAAAIAPPDEIVGELELDGLPGPLREHLAEKDFLAPDYFVVRHGRDPGSQSSFALILLGLGAVMFTGALLWARSKARPRVPGQG